MFKVIIPTVHGGPNWTLIIRNIRIKKIRKKLLTCILLGQFLLESYCRKLNFDILNVQKIPGVFQFCAFWLLYLLIFFIPVNKFWRYFWKFIIYYYINYLFNKMVKVWDHHAYFWISNFHLKISLQKYI